MTGFLTVGTTAKFSNITAGSLEDIGYDVEYGSDVTVAYVCGANLVGEGGQQPEKVDMSGFETVMPLYGTDGEGRIQLLEYDATRWMPMDGMLVSLEWAEKHGRLAQS
mmetsp:Transcript_20457/g.50493  ORF Transcript_20457/g.50493 Transcript_20457/m.50493 type:complete len:108 (-) Transcript_20457:336-659(-)